MMRMMHAVVILLALLALLGGCATVSQTPTGEAPADFTIDLAVLTGPAQDGVANAPWPAHLRQSRYVLLADGSLHYGEGEKMPWMPPRVRILNQRQIAVLWNLVEAQSLAYAAAAERPINMRIAPRPPAGRVLHLATFSAHEQWWTVRREQAIELRAEQASEAFAALIEHLAELAWAAPPDDGALRVPRRYDFGPDPYARYR